MKAAGKRKPFYLWPGLLYTATVAYALMGLDWVTFGHVAVRVLGALVLAAGLAIGVLAVKGSIRNRRRACDGPRAILLALARERAGTGGLWVNRDEHVAFFVEAGGVPLVRTWQVTRAEESQIRDLDRLAPGGRLAMTAVAFKVVSATPEVLREPYGAVFTAGIDGEVFLEEEPKAPRRQLARTIRLRVQAIHAGHLLASAGEITELVAQFQPAEFFGRDDPLEEQA